MTDVDPVVVDSRGSICPQPIIDLARRVRDLSPGVAVEVWATDPAAAVDVAAWCRMRGQTFVGSRELDEGTAYLVRLVPPG